MRESIGVGDTTKSKGANEKSGNKLVCASSIPVYKGVKLSTVDVVDTGE